MNQQIKTWLGTSIIIIMAGTIGLFSWKLYTESQEAAEDGVKISIPNPIDTFRPKACPEDAKICPDGTAVGRIAPDCEFDLCPDFVGLDNKLVVTSPEPEGYISSPVKVSGKAVGGWFFEGSFPAEVHDEKGRLLGSGPVLFTSQEEGGTWMTEQFVNFEGEIKFSNPRTESGYILFKKDNPSGKPELDEYFKLPVKFVGATNIYSWKIYKDDKYGFEFRYPAKWLLGTRKLSPQKIEEYDIGSDNAPIHFNILSEDGNVFLSQENPEILDGRWISDPEFIEGKKVSTLEFNRIKFTRYDWYDIDGKYEGDTSGNNIIVITPKFKLGNSELFVSFEWEQFPGAKKLENNNPEDFIKIVSTFKFTK